MQTLRDKVMDSLIIEICLLSLFIRNPWFPISSTQRYILTLSAMSIYPRLHHFDRHLRTGVGHRAAFRVYDSLSVVEKRFQSPFSQTFFPTSPISWSSI